MLKTTLLHPQILEALASAGHGAHVVIVDSNYPASVKVNPGAKQVYLNLAPGLISATDVVRVLAETIPVEAAAAMLTDEGDEPPVMGEYRKLLPGVNVQPINRFEFYKLARTPETCLIIATGEQRTYACILLTIGVVQPPA